VTTASSYLDSWEQRADSALFDNVIGVGFPAGVRERLLFRAFRWALRATKTYVPCMPGLIQSE
jgi:hypothetical protein